MKKTDRIAEFVAQLGTSPGVEGVEGTEFDPRYLGFFQCFNEQRYYEAHDVLEDLWLQGKQEPEQGNYRYFKGLIQVAGGFVHLQKQRLRPLHPKDGKRTRPASRLFQLAADNLAGYRPFHMALDVEALWAMCMHLKQEIENSSYILNPWDPEAAPQLKLRIR